MQNGSLSFFENREFFDNFVKNKNYLKTKTI